MEPGPRPPHERTWRHPSEIAAAERERHASTRQRSRTLVLATALVGIVMIGILSLVGGYATSPLNSSTAAVSTRSGSTGSEAVGSTSSATTATTLIDGDSVPASSTADTATSPDRPAPIATPVLNGSVAVMSAAGVPTSTDHQLPFTVLISTSPDSASENITGVILAISGGVALVKLSRTFEPLAIANPPTGTQSTEPTTGHLEPTCDGVEGSPSINAAGELVGLCVNRGGSMTIATVTHLNPLGFG